MREQFGPVEAPTSCLDIGEFSDFFAQFRQRQDVWSVVRQLSQISTAVQRHRGMSMALLAGNNLFQGDFDTLQAQITKRLAFLDVFAKHLSHILQERDQDNLHNAWQTISEDWQEDDVIDNFELHSHLIAQLQAMVVKLAEIAVRPVSVIIAKAHGVELPAQGEGYPKTFKQIELLDFSSKQMPAMVEHLARIRGLATYAAAKGQCDYLHDRKLRYEISCARVSHEKIRHQTERLEGLLGADLTALAMIKTYELKLMFLLNTVEMDILSGVTISSSSHQVFKLATEIIDVYLNVVEESIVLMGRWHDDDLEQWLSR